jgi:predicted transcriptional regulator
MAAGMKRTTSVNIRITDELRGELQRLADSNKRTLSDYVRLILEEHAEVKREREEDAAKRKRPAAG